LLAAHHDALVQEAWMKLNSQRTGMAAWLITALALAPVAGAQTLRADNLALQRIVAPLVLIDHYAGLCRSAGGFAGPLGAAYRNWEMANRAPLVRQAITVLRQEPASARDLDAGLASATRTLDGLDASACEILNRAMAQPDAHFGARDAAVLDQVARELAQRQNAAAPSPPAPPAAKVAPAQDSGAAKLAQDIEAIGFDWRTGFGFGGMVTIDTFPVLLFRNGDALMDVEGLAAQGGLAGHRRAHPDDWTKWRRQGGKLQKLDAGKWKDLGYQVTYQRLPADFALAGHYLRLTGGGNLAVGGTDAAAAFSTYDFFRDGGVIRGGGAGASSQFSDSRTVSRSVRADQRGRYQIDGIVLRIAYDDGSREDRILVGDPKDPDVIWLDGRGYTLKD
jgi:hypothetical protein